MHLCKLIIFLTNKIVLINIFLEDAKHGRNRQTPQIRQEITKVKHKEDTSM